MNGDDVKIIIDNLEDAGREMGWHERRALLRKELERTALNLNPTNGDCIRRCGFKAMKDDVLCLGCADTYGRIEEAHRRSDPPQKPSCEGRG